MDIALPTLAEVDNVCDCKFTKSSREITPVCLKPKDHEVLYDDAVKQCVIRTLHEAFGSTDSEAVTAVVVNGWVTFLDKATGHEKTSCVISVSRHATHSRL